MKEKFELREGEAFGEYKLAYPLESYGDDGELLHSEQPWNDGVKTLNKKENVEQFEQTQFA